MDRPPEELLELDEELEELLEELLDELDEELLEEELDELLEELLLEDPPELEVPPQAASDTPHKTTANRNKKPTFIGIPRVLSMLLKLRWIIPLFRKRIQTGTGFM